MRTKNTSSELLIKYKDLIDHQMQRQGGGREGIKRLLGERELIGAEIGVFFGINAYYMLNALYIARLYAIDPFTDKEIDVAFSNAGVSGEDAEQITREVLSRHKDKVEIVKGFSWDVVDFIPDELDFVYIDGGHGKLAVSKDLELYYPKVKVGGLFAGHDYVQDDPPKRVVKGTVDKFFKDKKETVVNAGRDWWIRKM
jgi:predicted O-methyltransferase YrrM